MLRGDGEAAGGGAGPVAARPRGGAAHPHLHAGAPPVRLQPAAPRKLQNGRLQPVERHEADLRGGPDPRHGAAGVAVEGGRGHGLLAGAGVSATAAATGVGGHCQPAGREG